MSTRINYNFGSNWMKVLAELQSDDFQPLIRKAVKKIYDRIYNIHHNSELFNDKTKGNSKIIIARPTDVTLPAEYATYVIRDGLMDCEYWNFVSLCWAKSKVEKRLEDGNMPSDWEKYNNRYNKTNDERSERIRDVIEETILEKYLTYNKLSKQIFSYIPFGYEDIWAKYVGLPLAKKITTSRIMDYKRCEW